MICPINCRYKFIWFIVLIAVSPSSACNRLFRAQQREWTIVSTSPGRTYQLLLHGRNDPPPFGDYRTGYHQVEYSVSRSGAKFIDNEGLYSGGTYDDFFLDAFPEQEWVGESSIRFGDPPDPTDRVFDELTVSNISNQMVRRFRLDVAKFEKFLVFDLAPGSSVKLRAFPQSRRMSDFCGFNFYAKFNSSELAGAGAFDPPAGIRGGGHFVIEVSDTEIKISSPDSRRRDKS